MNPVSAASLVGLTTSTGALIADPSGALIGLVVGTLLTSIASAIQAANSAAEKRAVLALLTNQAQQPEPQPRPSLGGAQS